MKVLFVSALLPYPLHSGGQIRMYHLLKRLAKNHEITLLSFIRDTAEVASAEKLDFCRKVLVAWRGRAWQPRYIISGIFSRYSFLLATYNNTFMRSLIQSEINQSKYDLIHIEPFYVFPSLPQLKLPLVVAEHNIEYKVYQDYVGRSPFVPLRPLMYLDVAKLKYWEERMWQAADQITVVSEEDQRAVTQKTKTNVTVVSNGVDLQAFPFQPKRSKNRAPSLLFVGNFAWVPNQQAARKLLTEIWPAVKKAIPQARLRIVGQGLPATLAQLVEQQGAVAVGEVANIVSEYQNADMLVAPLGIAGGTKFKILEAMAAGLPIVTTHEGIAGLKAEGGKHMLIAGKEPADWLAQLKKIWDNRDLGDKISKAARHLIEENYSWDAIADRLDDIWRKTHEERH